MSKSTHWMVHYPGEAYANDLRFKRPLDEREVREHLREHHGVKRLWNGVELWIA